MTEGLFWYDGYLFENGESGAGFLSGPNFDTAALRFGASVFTTLRVYGQDLAHPMTMWKAHCDRLTQSLTYFDWVQPDWLSIYQGAQQLKAHYLVLRLTVFPDGKVWITGRNLPPCLTQQQTEGVTCQLASTDYQRSFPRHKTGNYLACWQARKQAQRAGAQEAILMNSKREWLETATGNLWGVAQGQWWTPLQTQCLPGLMRQRLQTLLSAKGMKVNGSPWTRAAVAGFDAIAYSNCVVGLLPIHTILDRDITLKYNVQNASLKALQRQLASLTEEKSMIPEMS
ncbi:aminotransferase class IV [cf. Phormidesmis sp. LEGE 11477]|uniref:aminotransferase class IV n=1 Tax=cf. Phormidesmis sp. LEGE 11477 TaxID=1828680 RepID=UPI00187EFBA0|nr:aminotransferase class IV [cf. Phormidesmis sp. LEGE 11477]MBE9061299.1 aminotransferase class IV [cf. Phormidesmis sp. LEGE 11477]